MGREDILTIDPLAMGITNRIAQGCEVQVSGVYQGGLLIQGAVEGNFKVMGPLVVWAGASLKGQIEVFGDTYAFGQLGHFDESEEDGASSEIMCYGSMYIADTARSNASIAAQRLRSYDGAQIHGPFRTIRDEHNLPELQP